MSWGGPYHGYAPPHPPVLAPPAGPYHYSNADHMQNQQGSFFYRQVGDTSDRSIANTFRPPPPMMPFKRKGDRLDSTTFPKKNSAPTKAATKPVRLQDSVPTPITEKHLSEISTRFAISKSFLTRCATVMGRNLIEAQVKIDKRKKLLVFFTDIPLAIIGGERSVAGLKIPEQLKAEPSYESMILRMTTLGVIPEELYSIARSKQNVDHCLDILMPVMNAILVKLDEFRKQSPYDSLDMHPMIMNDHDWTTTRGCHLTMWKEQWTTFARNHWLEHTELVKQQLSAVPQGNDHVVFEVKAEHQIELERMQKQMDCDVHNAQQALLSRGEVKVVAGGRFAVPSLTNSFVQAGAQLKTVSKLPLIGTAAGTPMRMQEVSADSFTVASVPLVIPPVKDDPSSVVPDVNRQSSNNTPNPRQSQPPRMPLLNQHRATHYATPQPPRNDRGWSSHMNMDFSPRPHMGYRPAPRFFNYHPLPPTQRMTPPPVHIDQWRPHEVMETPNYSAYPEFRHSIRMEAPEFHQQSTSATFSQDAAAVLGEALRDGLIAAIAKLVKEIEAHLVDPDWNGPLVQVLHNDLFRDAVRPKEMSTEEAAQLLTGLRNMWTSVQANVVQRQPSPGRSGAFPVSAAVLPQPPSPPVGIPIGLPDEPTTIERVGGDWTDTIMANGVAVRALSSDEKRAVRSGDSYVMRNNTGQWIIGTVSEFNSETSTVIFNFGSKVLIRKANDLFKVVR